MFQRSQKGGGKWRLAFNTRLSIGQADGVNRGIKGRDGPCNADADICLMACLILEIVSHLPGETIMNRYTPLRLKAF